MAGSSGVATGTFAGRYTIEREIGRGATATVFLARDSQRGVGVAIKVLREDVALNVGADRFLREVRITQNLQHPHIVPVLDSGQSEGQLYCVLPHMEEGSLRQLLQREKQLPVETAIAITRSVAEALDYAHAQGLIHRDVKPENILFTSGQACLADFGIARAIERTIDESTTSTGLVRGTPAYMSPEQASGSATYDGRSDIYSLALVVYEMLAGVPAFIGPTAEAVIAQRFLHQPRPLRVYRPQVPATLMAALDRALSLAAADRFPSATQFVSAIEQAWNARHTAEAAPRSARWRIPGGRVAAVGAISIFAMVLGGPWAARRMGLWTAMPTDTTRYALLPLEGSSPTAPAAYERLYQSLAAWRGLTLVTPFEIADAVRRTGGIRTDEDAEDAARTAGARRYIRGSLAAAGDSLRLSVALFDLLEPRALASITRMLPPDATTVGRAFDAVAATLLLRGQEEATVGTRSLPAAQLFQRAMVERNAFDLRNADSLLRRALEYDTTFSDAALMLAQMRLWRREHSAPWQVWTERARALGAQTALGTALAALARGDPGACTRLSEMTADTPGDFALWYTLATCLTIDTAVIMDGTSRSGWRFRSSYQDAVRAYTRAFTLAPTLHRRFQAGAYRDLRDLLFTSRGRLRSGSALPPDTGRFFAYAEWAGDSLLFVPFPRLAVIRGEVSTNVAARDAAVRAQRRLFADIARAWSEALPDNASTKEALAISLDMLGDVSALDSMRSARRLAAGTPQAFALAAEEVLLRASWGRLDAAHLRTAKALGDSLLRAHARPSPDQADLLARIAALLGRCALAGSLAGRALPAQEARAAGVDLATLATAESLTVITALGCRGPDSLTMSNLSSRIVASSGGLPAAEQFQLQWAILGRLARLTVRADSSQVSRWATPSNDYLLKAALAAWRGDSAQAIALLEQRRNSRGALGTSEISPEVVVSEALVWQHLARPRAGGEWLDPLVNRPSWLDPLLQSRTSAAALVRAAALRAELATPAEAAHRERWSAFVRALWSDADPWLRSHVQELQSP